MPPATGVAFIVQLGNDRQTITLAGGGGADTYVLSFEGQSTAPILETASAATIQTALEGLSTIGAGNVAVAGAGGGPYTVDFQGSLAGQAVPLLVASAETGGLTATVAAGTPQSFVTLAGQRGGRLGRTVDEADFTSKDSNSWHDGAPVIRNWTVAGDNLVVEGDASQQKLEDAYLNQHKVWVQIQTPAANIYRGTGTIDDLSMDGPHDDALTGAISIKGAGALSKNP